jgi:uncharacterized repeat protein (TIGR02543 family)
MAFTVVLLSIPQFVYSGTPHSVSGIVTYSEGGSPSSANFTAHIKSRTGETQTQSSAGCGYSGGYYWVQCGNFPTSWNAGDVLHVNMNDGAGRSTSGEVTLTNEANDPLNLVLPQLQIKSITITTNPSGLAFTVDGTPYSGAQVFSWQVASSHTISVASLISGGTGIRYLFASWSDGGDKDHSITIDGTTVYVANFKVQYYLTATSDPPEGGNVLPVPPHNWYDANTQVILSAFVGTDTMYVFANWSGDLSGNSNPVTLVMDRPKSVTAVFTLKSFHLTTKVEPSGAGTVHCIPEKSSYMFGETVKMTVEVAAGYQFKGWNVDGTDYPISDTLAIGMDKDKRVTAKFKIVNAVDDKNMSGMPNDDRLSQNYPNPFNPTTMLSYGVSTPGELRLVIYNSRGQKIRVLRDGYCPAGSFDVKWDGLDDTGNSAGSRIYVAVLR